MAKNTIPPDDLLDVVEMTKNLEICMYNILGENETSLSMSALISATVNSTIAQCDTIDEIILYRDIFSEVFDGSIRNLRRLEREY